MRRRRPAAPVLSVTTAPCVRAGSETDVTVAAEGAVRVSLRLLGWDRRRAEKWPLAEVGAGTHRVAIPAGLAPGCARMTEYAILVERVGGRGAAAAPVRLVSDQVWWPEGPRATGDLELEDEVVAIGGVVRGRSPAPVEIGAELHTLAATPRFLPVATVPAGPFAVTLPTDIAPTLSDGEELAISWTVRAGDAYHRFAVTDPDGTAGERRPPLLTFLAQLARDPFTAG